MECNQKGLVVIADDLTGANDTGVQFARRGLKTNVLLEGTPLERIGDSIVVVDTNSRAIAGEEAYRRVQAVARQSYQAGVSRFYKKIDSTLRGNVGIEIKAILDLEIHDFAFVMPAFPKTGRTTVGGNHLLQGIPLAATEIAKDPKCPVSESCLPELLLQQTGLTVVHIGVDELLKGTEVIRQAIQNGLEAGCRIFSCDAWLDDQFSLAAEAAAGVSDQILWVGSAGLADYLPKIFGWEEPDNTHLPTLVVAGSVSSVTRGQIDRLLQDGYQLVEIEVSEYLPWREAQALPLLAQLEERLSQGQKLVIASGYQPEVVERAKQAGAKLGLGAVQVSELIAQMLGWLGANLLNKQEVTGVVLTGGDTAVAVCRALGVTGIHILEEIAPGIPLGLMTTNGGKTLKVVTKAGAFGNPDALVKASHKLQQRM